MEKYTIRDATKTLFERYLNEFNLTNNLKELSTTERLFIIEILSKYKKYLEFYD